MNNFIPPGYNTASPYLLLQNVDVVMEFLKKVFGAEEHQHKVDSGGKVIHAEVRIGDSIIMMGGVKDVTQALPGSVHIYLSNVDEAYQKALLLGAHSIQEPTDRPFGDRVAGIQDTEGNFWWIATHISNN